MVRNTIWCYVDGERTCDAVAWALEHKLMIMDAKIKLAELHQGKQVEFLIEELD